MSAFTTPWMPYRFLWGMIELPIILPPSIVHPAVDDTIGYLNYVV